ncbi:MAG: GIY-YIG nuclease family protein [Candidatus Levybacteria bacterium]|nr:GIY-YIG nuclease family protein [Candidatus Levybacteria bacterium]
MFFVYVLKNDWSNKIYVGQTIDLETRLRKHNGLLRSKLNSYTMLNKGSGTWIVIYKEEYLTRHESLKREKYLKSHAGRDWLKKHMGP